LTALFATRNNLSRLRINVVVMIRAANKCIGPILFDVELFNNVLPVTNGMKLKQIKIKGQLVGSLFYI